jgi:phosphoribosyl-AMP cyclohydrolase
MADKLKSEFTWDDMKTDANGLVPCIAQDVENNEVLMLAYVNEEAFKKTLETGLMTYYSISRKELWTKGLTSGHLQYVQSIEIDCDNDTLLAKVKQVGAACHTGNRSCFYRNLTTKEEEE